MATKKVTKTYTPKQLADELNIDPKKLRAYLRKEYPRTVEEKNTSWTIAESAAAAARKNFAKTEAKS